MKGTNRFIIGATGLSMKEFCENYLETDARTFGSRLKKNRLYPNEALLICLITGKTPQEMFGLSAIDLFCLKGKHKGVSARVKDLLDKPGGNEKLNLILNSDGLKFNLEEQSAPQKRVKKAKVVSITQPEEEPE